MSEKLEKRLREYDGRTFRVCHEAAAELKAQREEIARLEKEKKIWSTLTEHKVRGKLLLMEQRAEKAEADRDHWEEQAEKNHKATLEAMQENDRLREALREFLNAEWMISPSWTSSDQRNAVFEKAKAALGEQDGS